MLHSLLLLLLFVDDGFVVIVEAVVAQPAHIYPAVLAFHLLAVVVSVAVGGRQRHCAAKELGFPAGCGGG